MIKNYVLCMTCFCSEDSRGDDCRAKFSLVYEIRASEADGDDVTAVSLTLGARCIIQWHSIPERF